MRRASTQLTEYLRQRAASTSAADAAESVGMNKEEARLTEIARDRGELDDIDLNPPTIGHNSKDSSMAMEDASSGAAQDVRRIVERIERLEEEKKGIGDDIKDILAEAKGQGHDTKIIRKIISIRKMKKGEFEEQQALIETYMNALGMLADTPLGRAALGRMAA